MVQLIFFYENKSESQPVSTISSSCYLRDYTNEGTPRESWGNYYRNNDKFAILTNGERGDIARRDYDDYSIKSVLYTMIKVERLTVGVLPVVLTMKKIYI